MSENDRESQKVAGRTRKYQKVKENTENIEN